MEQDSVANTPSQITSLGGKSWVAYAPYVFLALGLLMIAFALGVLVSPVAGVLMLAASLALIVYNFMSLKSYHLYFDDDGVWVYSGILPWNKGVAGVKWRDLDEAVYFRSIGSWLFKSYSIRIGHRFTKSSEIRLSDWSRGHEAVMAINGKHQELVRMNALG